MLDNSGPEEGLRPLGLTLKAKGKRVRDLKHARAFTLHRPLTGKDEWIVRRDWQQGRYQEAVAQRPRPELRVACVNGAET